MLTVLSPQAIQGALRLQKLIIEPNVKIYCNTSPIIVRSFIPKPLRRQAFKSVHGLAHPNGRVTCHQMRKKYILPGIKKDALQ
ncbi:hypothetical protein M0802_012741 [Mischocyttarus mexicanus]|nr:hypothetical protein M0802_012741 [Mischocyttarus mexicanus]